MKNDNGGFVLYVLIVCCIFAFWVGLFVWAHVW